MEYLEYKIYFNCFPIFPILYTISRDEYYKNQLIIYIIQSNFHNIPQSYPP